MAQVADHKDVIADDILKFKWNPLGYALQLSAGTLLTMSEMQRLTWSDINLQKRTVRVAEGRRRVVPMTQKAYNFIGHWRDKNPQARAWDKVFTENHMDKMMDKIMNGSITVILH